MGDDICIYLGLKTDPNTALEFPSIGNHCHKVRPVAPVNAKHQEKYCLTAQHTECPIFKRAAAARIPTRAAADRSFFQRNRVLMVVILLTMIFAGAAIASVAMRENAPLAAPTTVSAGLALDPTSTPTPTPSPSNSPTLTPKPANSATPLGGFRPFLPTVDKTRQACPRPSGWIRYIVKANDTLVSVSLAYNITVDELLLANCMSEDADISAGERLYVPGATATPTPTSSFTPTRTRTRRPYVPPTNTPEPNEPAGPSPTSPTPTYTPPP